MSYLVLGLQDSDSMVTASRARATIDWADFSESSKIVVLFLLDGPPKVARMSRFLRFSFLEPVAVILVTQSLVDPVEPR
jgi:hypothetical protein